MAEPFIVEPTWSYKRFLLLKALNADAMDQPALAAAWRGLLAEQPPSDELPMTFPFRARLIAAGYKSLVFLNGATEDELAVYAGFAPLDARTVVAATTAALTPPEDA